MKAADVSEPCRRARLRHVSDAAPGITRRRRGNGFQYTSPSGRPVRDDDRKRIEALAIPPAWERVWICPDERGHLQATGYDSKGRKQYRYHERWTEARNAAKFADLHAFGSALPAIRTRIERDLNGKELNRTKVLACVLRILDSTLVRVGNEEYTRANGSFGLTTVRSSHVQMSRGSVCLNFRAKSGKQRCISIESKRAAQVVRRCKELPGQHLFTFVTDDGRPHHIDSGDVNTYLHEIAGDQFSAKHFRTWGGSVYAAEALRAQGFPRAPLSERAANQRWLQAIDAAAQHLGNTRAICRKYYVHPLLRQADLDGRLEAAFEKAAASKPRPRLRLAERALLYLLTQSKTPHRARSHKEHKHAPDARE